MAQIPTSIYSYSPLVRTVLADGGYAYLNKSYDAGTTILIGSNGSDLGKPTLVMSNTVPVLDKPFRAGNLEHRISLTVTGANNSGNNAFFNIIKVLGNGKSSSAGTLSLGPQHMVAGAVLPVTIAITLEEVGAGISYTFEPIGEVSSGVYVSTNIDVKFAYWKITSTSCCSDAEYRFAKAAHYEDGDGRPNFDILEENSVECGYFPYGALIPGTVRCGTGVNRYNKVGTYSKGTYSSEFVFDTYEGVVEYNSLSCGYIPAGTLMSEFCATDRNRRYSRVGVYSNGLFNAETGAFGTYEAVIEKDSVSCGYQPRGTLLRSACSTGSDNHRQHEMIGFYSEGTYDADGNFNTYEEVLDPRSVACGYVPTGNVTFTSNNSDALFSVPGKGVYASNQTVNNWTLGNYTYTVRSEGNAEQSGSFYLGEAGHVVSADFPNPVSLPGQDGPSYEEKPHIPSDDVYYEAVLTDPLSYRVVDRAALGGAFNFTYTESYRSFSAFSFSLKGTVREFEDLISLDSGRAGILLYVNGVQRIQGLIQNYSPSGEGFITVNCSEILAGLDDAWSGKLDLNNILFEYIPSETGIEASTDLATLYEYWNKGFGKSNFFFTPGINNYSRVGETSEGVVVPEGSTNDLYIRPFSSRNFLDYTLHIKGLGKPFSRLYLSNSVYIQFTGNSFDLMSNGSILRSTGSIDTYTVGGGTQPLIDSLSNAEVYYKALVNPSGIEFQVRVKYLGVFKEYNIPFTYLTLGPPDVHVSLGNGAGIAKLYVESPQKRTFLDWLNTVGTGQGDNVQVRFIQGAGARATGTALRLTYTDGNRWNIVSEILELMGNATLEYYGLLQGTPTFFVHDYSELSILNKFYDTGEIFNTSYQKDLANVYNVLEVRAADSVQGSNQTTNNTFSITIAPSPERPNRLGKTRKTIQGAEGVTDIDTLLKYALSVYEEISSPKEAVDFEIHTSSFWLEVLVGQYVNIFGLPEGKKITEQINSITFTEATGITRIELADRLSLASAFLQARLKANSF